MEATDFNTPVLILNCKLGGLAIMRSLGELGAPLYVVEADPADPALSSRYCKKYFIQDFDLDNPAEYLDRVLSIGESLDRKSILIPTSDELAVFVAEYADELGQYFIFPRNDPDLVKNLISKEGMYKLAVENGIPTPITLFPKRLGDVSEYVDKLEFPMILKGIHGNRLFERAGTKMVIVNSKNELIEKYRLLDDPEKPNLMIQEYIPGQDDEMYIVDAYFNENSECLVYFTGHKIRQYPIHAGCASLGICKWNQRVADIAVKFMRTIGYKGILDSGYRYDLRDDQYKVLDINPRVGQAFRLFVGTDGMDVVRASYLDLLGNKVSNTVGREGRRWVIEDYDLESSMDYFREGTLSLSEWIKSYRGVEEAAWFNRNDLRPFIHIAGKLTQKAMRWAGKQFRPKGN